ncbi:uncharacterized protein C1orf167 homolog isoform 13-T16 [Lycaon pictus]
MQHHHEGSRAFLQERPIARLRELPRRGRRSGKGSVPGSRQAWKERARDPSHQTGRTAGHVDHGRRGLGLALEPAELRRYGSRKDLVLLGPTTPPGWSEQRRWPKSLDAGPGRGPGRGAPTCRVQRFPSPSPGAVLRREPGRVQSNLAAPSLVLMDADRLMNSSPQQQSNLPPPARPQGRARDPAVQQSNLSARGTGLAGRRRCSPRPPPELHESVGPPGAAQGSPRPPGSLACPSSTLRSPRLLATDTPCPDVPPAAGSAPFNGCAQPDPGPWGGLRSGPSRLVGEPLTLEDLTVPVHGRAQAPSHTAVHQLLASVRHLERAVARLGCRPSQEAPGPAQRAPWSSSGQALAAPPQPGRPGLAPWGGRKEHPGRLGGSADCPETRGSQAGPAGSQASRRPASSLEATLGTLAGDCLAPKDGVPPATPQRQEESSPGPPCGSWQRGDPQLPPGAGSREARRYSWAWSSATRDVPPGRGGGEVAPQEQSSREEERMASWPPDAAPAGSGLQEKARNIAGLESETAGRPWLSPCFRAWWRWVQRRRAAAALVARGRRQLLRRGLWALRGALRLREAQLEAAWGRHTQALLAQSFQKWRNRTLQQKQGQPPVRAGPGPPRPGPGGGQDPSGKGPEVDPARSSSPARGGISFSPGNFPRGPGSQREEAAAWPGPDGGDGGAQMLQALGHLAVFLLWCHQKKWGRQDRGAQRKNPRVPPRTQGMGRPPEAWCSHAVDAPRAASPDTQPRRAWLGRFRGPSGLSKASTVAQGRWLSLPSSLVPAPPWLPRCFGAWQRFAQRGAGFRERLAHRRAHTLRLCLQQWLRMRRLRASDGAKVTQLSLCRQKAGSATLCGAAPGVAPARGLGVVARVQAPAQEQGRGSLQEACRRLALQRALLLWRTRLSQRRRPGPVSPSLHPSRGRAPMWLPPESGVLGPGAQLHLPSGAWLRSASISDWALRQLQHILSGGHLTARGLSASAPELLGSLPGGEPWLGGRPLRSSPQQAFRAPAPLETLGLSFRWASGQRRKGRCLRLWQRPARLEPLGLSPRGPERAGRQLGPGPVRPGCAALVAAAAGAAAGGGAAGPGSGSHAGSRRPAALAHLLAEAAVPAWKVPEVGAGPPPGLEEVDVPALAAGSSSSETPRGPAGAASTAQPLPGLVCSRERRRGAPSHESLSGWPGRGPRGGVGRVAGCPSSRSLGTGAACGPGLRGPLEEARAGAPGRQTAPEGPGPAGLCGVAHGSGPALQGPPAGGRESRPVPGTAGTGVPPAPGQPSPGCPEAERQGPGGLGPGGSEGPRPASRRHTVPPGWVQRPPVDPQGPAVGATGRDPGGPCGGPRGSQQGVPPSAAGHSSPTEADPPPRHAARPRPEHRRTGADTGDPRAERRRPARGPPGPPRRAARRTPSGLGLPGPGRRRGQAPGEEIRAALAPRGVASPAPGLGAGQAPGSDMAALGRCSGRGAAGTDAAEAVAPEVGLACVAAAGPAAAGGSAITATRRWLGPFPGL